MSKVTYMHPLCKTYEELKRCRDRVESIKTNNLVDKIPTEAYETMIHHLDETIALIPEEFQKTRHDLVKADTE